VDYKHTANNSSLPSFTLKISSEKCHTEDQISEKNSEVRFILKEGLENSIDS